MKIRGPRLLASQMEISQADNNTPVIPGAVDAAREGRRNEQQPAIVRTFGASLIDTDRLADVLSVLLNEETSREAYRK